jgi:hypothetical protein
MRGLYWRRYGDFRYYTPRRRAYWGLGALARYKRAGLVRGREAA